jgi:hypothetical protein
MVALLAWLAERYGIDPRPGATASFVSRGSNRWPAGASVTTATITGHRDMSKTACPGDAAYHLVRNDFPTRVATALGLAAAAPPMSTTTATAASTTTASTAASTTTASASSTTTATAASQPPTTQEAAAPRGPPGDHAGWQKPAAGFLGLLATAALAVRARSRRSGHADWPLGGNPRAQKGEDGPESGD